jgi:hypothetical protein
VFENRVLRTIFGQQRDKATGGWRKLQNIIRIIKSRKMRRAGHVARMRRRGIHIGCWWESQRKETTRKTKT